MHANPDRHTPGASERYEATYTFSGHRRQPPNEAISRIRETVMGMQDEGIEIEFLGATGEIDLAGKVIEVTARYSAPSEGIIGWLNWRSGLPASGSPRRTDTAVNTTTKQPSPRLS